MSKSTFDYKVQRVTYETNVPVSTVLSRLDEELNRAQSKDLLRALTSNASKEELEKVVLALTENGARDFMFFGELRHDAWLNPYLGSDGAFPVMNVYTLGNPLIAQTMIPHNAVAGYYVPPKVFVIGEPDGKGAKVIYDLPSTLIAAGQDGELKKAAEVLDTKLEALVKKITAM